MTWDKNLSNLRNVLAGLYWNVEEARRMVLEVGMNPAFIRFSGKSINTWTDILEQAQHHDKIRAIIAKAHEEYPNLQELTLAEQNLLLAVESPEITEDTWLGTTDASKIEKIIGAVSTLRPISFLQRGLEMSRPVARVMLADGSLGSGFLIKDNLLITNNHVISSETVAQTAVVEFNYQKTLQGLDAPVTSYELAPEEGFATSPLEELGGDDWTAVQVKGNPNEKWGAIPLGHAAPKVGDEVIIIQHPGGGQKQIALSHNVVVSVTERRLQYLTDTLGGSSGSPVFSTEWQVVAVHHRGGWLREPHSKHAVYRNQGVHVKVLIEGLAKASLV